MCDHSNESCQAILSCGTVYCALQDGSNMIEFLDEILSVTIQMKAAKQYFPVVLFIVLHKGVVI